jgi:hypothetical protein
MPLHDTSDISDDEIKQQILEVNSLYSEIIRRLFNVLDDEKKKRVQGTVSVCCSEEEIQLLTRLVRIFIENYQMQSDRRLPVRYAVFAILYYYYQLELIESTVTSFLHLEVLNILYKVPKEYIAGIHILSNFLIVSDEPYVVEIRRSILKLNQEPFVGGKYRRRKNGIRHRKTHKTRVSKKRKTRSRR